MKIYRKAFPLPLGEIPVEEGEVRVDNVLTEWHIQSLYEKYSFKKHLGGGSFGIAFSTFDDKVVKITTDLKEYKAAIDIIGSSWQKYSPFAKIYEAYELEDGEEIYVIVKDLVTPLNEEERNLFDLFVGEFNSEIEKVPEEFKDKMPLFEEFDSYIYDVLNYSQYADTLNDGNIGRDSEGKLVAFDFRER